MRRMVAGLEVQPVKICEFQGFESRGIESVGTLFQSHTASGRSIFPANFEVNSNRAHPGMSRLSKLSGLIAAHMAH